MRVKLAYKKNNKAQLTLDYVLSVAIIIVVISFAVVILSNYNETITEDYERATIKSIAADLSYTITSIYVTGHESEITPLKNEIVMVARGSVALPSDIKRKFYGIEINSTDNSVCGSVNKVSSCAKIVGLPSEFNITDMIGENRTISVTYWRERNETSAIRDYILVG